MVMSNGMLNTMTGRMATRFCLYISQVQASISIDVESVDSFSPFKSQDLIFLFFLVFQDQNYSNQ